MSWSEAGHDAHQPMASRMLSLSKQRLDSFQSRAFCLRLRDAFHCPFAMFPLRVCRGSITGFGSNFTLRQFWNIAHEEKSQSALCH